MIRLKNTSYDKICKKEEKIIKINFQWNVNFFYLSYPLIVENNFDATAIKDVSTNPIVEGRTKYFVKI
jgi:hypothetical protein